MLRFIQSPTRLHLPQRIHREGLELLDDEVGGRGLDRLVADAAAQELLGALRRASSSRGRPDDADDGRRQRQEEARQDVEAHGLWVEGGRH